MSPIHTLFQSEMEERLVRFKERVQYLPATNTKRKWQYYDWADNLFPPIRHGFRQYAYDAALPCHEYLNHVRSSQAFAINLLYPLLCKEPEVVLACLGEAVGRRQVKLLEYFFEYSPETNLLGEWRSDENRPDEYVTAADAAVMAEDEAGGRSIFLIEVKFTEDGFTKCGGYESPGNKAREVCLDRAAVFADRSRCYLQYKSRGKSARTYLDVFGDLDADFPGRPEETGCPFRENHQCLRNHAFARALARGGEYERAYFGLLYHDGNKEIQGEWGKYLGLVSEELRRELFAIGAAEMLGRSTNETLRRYFGERYGVGAD